MKDIVVDFNKTPEGLYVVKTKVGEKWIDGASYFMAFKNAYKRVGENIGKFAQEDGH